MKEISKNQTKHKIDLTLDRVFEALKILGNPEKDFPPVIHVAGTNGKGSTIAFMRAIFESAGYKCHVYTSPHLVKFNERIVIAGNEIADEYLEQLIKEVNDKCEHLGLTFFESTTLVAYLAFSRNKADVLLLETGMGGRLDATNIIEKPALTIITPISYDHMEFLGDTLQKIAHEKACIMKKGVKCIISGQTDEAKKVLYDYAGKIGAQIIESKTDNNIPKPSLEGKHQYINACCAVDAVKNLYQFNISEENIIKGLTTAKWPARLQKLEENVYLDGAHNIEGAKIIAEFIRESKGNKKVILILGMLKNKDLRGFLSELKDSADLMIAVNIEGENSFSADEISKRSKELELITIERSNAISALNYAKQIEPESLIIICGSLYMAGQILAPK